MREPRRSLQELRDQRERIGLIRAIHTAKRSLGLDDDAYRAMLERVAGKPTSAVMTLPELHKVMEELRRLGFGRRPAKRAGRAKLSDSPQARMIRGMWIELHRAGHVKNPSEASLDRFVRRVTGVESLGWLEPADANKVIEALKKWSRRVGIVLPEVE